MRENNTRLEILPKPSTDRSLTLLALCGLSLLVLVVYLPVRNFDFIDVYDDDSYVINNPNVAGGLTPEGARWAFGTFYKANWHPLSWLSHMTDVELMGMRAGGHHLTSVAIHLASTVLLLLVLRSMTGVLWPGTFVAAIFGLHPLHVESVAWISERKDVLSALFWILAMGAYLRYCRRPGVKNYLAVLLCFVLGLMAKPMTVTLPFVLLLLDYWPLRRLQTPAGPKRAGRVISRPLLEKVPFFALSGLSSAVTYLAQSKGEAVTSLEILGFWSRAANAAVAYAHYLLKALWPLDLAIIYPHPGNTLSLTRTALAVSILAGITAVVLWRRRQPYLLTGWLWYLGTLVPVAGFVQVGAQSMADRYTYLPFIGLSVMVAWGLYEALGRHRLRNLMLAAALSGVIGLLAPLARSQVGYWRNSETLFSRAVEVVENNAIAYKNLGKALYFKGRFDEAITHHREAIRIKPNFAEAHNNLGAAYYRTGDIDAAMEHFRRAIQLRRDYVEAYNNLGGAHSRLGQKGLAIEAYRKAIELDPANAHIHNNLGQVFAALGEPSRAREHYERAIGIDPNLAEAHNNLGVVLSLIPGASPAARDHYETAIRINPGYYMAHYNLGNWFIDRGNLLRARESYEKALRIKPDFTNARIRLARVLERLGVND